MAYLNTIIGIRVFATIDGWARLQAVLDRRWESDDTRINPARCTVSDGFLLASSFHISTDDMVQLCREAGNSGIMWCVEGDYSHCHTYQQVR
jgi:hypothetical protein